MSVRSIRLGFIRYERCACGGWLVAQADDLEAAVASHNATTEHLVWRRARGLTERELFAAYGVWLER